MAENEDKSLIGFDPLAWMDGDSEDEKQQTSKAITANKEADEVSDAKNDTDKTEDSIIVLDATLNIQNVRTLYEQIKTQLDQQNKIEIDASAVELIDTANLQLLGVLKQTAVKLHKEIVFDFPSEKFIESAELLGLSEVLDVDQAAAGFF